MNRDAKMQDVGGAELARAVRSRFCAYLSNSINTAPVHRTAHGKYTLPYS